MEFMSRFAPQTHALLRIVAGLLFLWHGSQKLFDFPFEMPPGAPGWIVAIAGPIEFFGGILVMIGLMTRYAAFLCSGLMAAAYWIGHGLPGLEKGFAGLFPTAGGGNGGELAALYCFAFLFLAANGAGIWSVDAARGAK
jgi:putative oxidoreductase